jgi:hypothetical protein
LSLPKRLDRHSHIFWTIIFGDGQGDVVVSESATRSSGRGSRTFPVYLNALWEAEQVLGDCDF